MSTHTPSEPHPDHVAGCRRGHHSERGAVLALTAIAMIGVLAFASLAVDMGMIRSKRAVYQHAADTAALVGGWHLSKIVDPNDPAQLAAGLQAASSSIKKIVEQNLGLTATDWANCTDLGHLPYAATADTAISNSCLSFNPFVTPRQTRVRLPNLTVDHAFGIGTSTVSASAGTAGSACDPSVDICSTTTTTVRPSTTTSARPVTTTTRPRTTTTIRRVTTTTRPSPTTTRPRTTTTRPPTTTTRPPATTTTFLDLGS